MRSFLIAAVSGLLLTASAASAQAPASAVGPRPSYNMQRAGEDIGPFAGGAKTHRAAAGRSAAHGKAHRGDHPR
jgi:opacity protein-like surface antigen